MIFEKAANSDHPLRIWIRLPNWLGDVVMAVPLIRALQQHRPDAELSILAQPHFMPLLEKMEPGADLIPIPGKGGLSYFRFFAQLRKQSPDVHILFTNSTRGDLESRVIGAKQRIGIARPGKPRRLLTHTWPLPVDLDEATIHQTHLWEKFLRHFGVDGDLDLSPVTSFQSARKPKRIGLICATENSPEKRWPIEYWRDLIEAMPDQEFHLFGTPRDAAITSSVAEGFSEERVQDRAGKTGLVEFAHELCQCEVLISNDTGGMHLANMLGVAVVGLFGPTNPVRTGPIFDAPTVLARPEGCPKTGGVAIEKLAVAEVIAAYHQCLDASRG